MTNKKVIISLSLMLVLVSLITLGCAKGDTKKAQTDAEQNQAISVETTTVKRGEIANYITVMGTAKPVKSAKLSPQLQENVTKVLVDEGERVKAGKKLIQLDQEDINSKVNEAKVALKTAQAGLEQLLAGAREEEIDKLNAQLAQAKANYEQAESNYNRYKKLFNKDAISKQQLEGAQTKYISAKNSYKSLEESLKMAKKGPTKEQIKVQQAQVAQAKARLNTAQLNLAKTKITAPFSGIITAVNVEEGEMVGGQPVVTMIDLSSVKLKAHINENNINDLSKGQQVEVDFNALENKLKGRIKTINPSLNQREQGFPVEIKVTNSGDLIKSGMYAEIEIETKRSSETIFVPKQAVIQENGDSYLYLVKGNKAVKQQIKTGLSTTEKIEVLSGINVGEQVITVGAERVTAGYKVDVVGGGAR